MKAGASPGKQGKAPGLEGTGSAGEPRAKGTKSRRYDNRPALSPLARVGSRPAPCASPLPPGSSPRATSPNCGEFLELTPTKRGSKETKHPPSTGGMTAWPG